MKETERKPRNIAARLWGIGLVILSIVCLLIVLWIVMIVTRVLMGLG